MFTRVHPTHDITMQKEIYNHLCEMMRNILLKDRKFLTPKDEVCIQDTANIDLNHIITSGSLITYYNRMKAGEV